MRIALINSGFSVYFENIIITHYGNYGSTVCMGMVVHWLCVQGNLQVYLTSLSVCSVLASKSICTGFNLIFLPVQRSTATSPGTCGGEGIGKFSGG